MVSTPGLWWPMPEAGDIVWCHFPHLPGVEPGPKPRPALVVRVRQHQSSFLRSRVLVAYGTSQKTGALRRGEFLIRNDGSTAFKLSGLSFDTKFSFADSVELDFAEPWFKRLVGAPNSQTPKIGVLHAVYGKAAYAAYLAVQSLPT